MSRKAMVLLRLLVASLGIFVRGNASAAYNTGLAVIEGDKSHMLVTFQRSQFRLVSEAHRGPELSLIDPAGAVRVLDLSSMAFDPATRMLTVRRSAGLWRSVLQNIDLDTGTIYLRYMEDSPTNPVVRGSWVIQGSRLVMGKGVYDGDGRLCELDERRTPACIDLPLTVTVIGSR